MGKVRQAQLDGIQDEIKVLNLAGGFEKKKIEALWSQWEKLNGEELSERTAPSDG